MIDYRPEEFNGMLCNVYNLSQKDPVLERWPFLQEIDALQQPANFPLPWDTVLRYIILMYDQQSPIVKRTPSIKHRKRDASILAGFEVNEEMTFDKEVVRMWRHDYQEVTNAWIAYSRLHMSHKWETICIMKEAHYRNGLLLLSGEYKFKDYSENAKEIEELEAKLDNEEKSLVLSQNAHLSVQVDIGITPEHIAQNIKQGEKVVNIEPYEKIIYIRKNGNQ